jgi:hypothetical protein
VNDDDIGAAQNSEHTAGVDGALSTGLHKIASRQRAKTSELRRSAVELAVRRESGAAVLDRHRCTAKLDAKAVSRGFLLLRKGKRRRGGEQSCCSVMEMWSGKALA